jgi:beta-glucanase (GH16 family)
LFLPKHPAFLLVSGLLLLLASEAEGQTWNQVWGDEFSGPLGTPIDKTKWTFETGILRVNNEVENYCAPGMTTGGCDATRPNAYIDGSDHLVIQALKIDSRTVPNRGSWTSARMTTKAREQIHYGRVEARMKLPVGPGVWPAFWALGTNISTVGWPNCGEIDYMENVPASGGLGATKISSTLHALGYSGAHGWSQIYAFPTGDVTLWHTYGAIWSPNMIQFYVDDPSRVFFVRTAGDLPTGQDWAFNHPFFLLLNMAVGGDGSWPGSPEDTTPNPAIMTVDYVRIYRAAAVPAPRLGKPASITVKAGERTETTSTLRVRNQARTGRVFLSCSTTASNATCQVTTDDRLNSHTLDFSEATTGSARITVTTLGGATARGPYTVTVNAYTVGGNGASPDATVNIPFTVN